jgi:hypothetical protein
MMRRPSFVTLCLLCLLILPTAAPADNQFRRLASPLGRGQEQALLLVRGRSWVPVGKVRELPAGTRLYHWTSKKWFERYSRQGTFTAADVRGILQGSGGMVGPGLYASLNPWDNARYGSCLLVITLRRPVRLLRATSELLTPQGGRPLIAMGMDPAGKRCRAALKAAGISGFSEDYECPRATDWLNLFDLSSVACVQPPSRADFARMPVYCAPAGGKRTTLPVGLREALRVDQFYSCRFGEDLPQRHLSGASEAARQILEPAAGLSGQVRSSIQHHLDYGLLTKYGEDAALRDTAFVRAMRRRAGTR